MTGYKWLLLAVAAMLTTAAPARAGSTPAKLVIAYAAMSPRVAPL